MDDQGNLFVTGRIKDSIKTSHGLISAEEIEEAIDMILPFDPLHICAALSLSNQETSQTVVIKEAPKSLCCQSYADLIHDDLHKKLALHIDRLMLVARGQIPRTTNGKVKRHAALILLQHNIFEPLETFSFTDHYSQEASRTLMAKSA